MVTSTLPLGGAEQTQLSVLAGLDRDSFECEVVCLRDGGTMAESFRRAGVSVTVLGRRRLQHLTTVPALARLLRRRSVDIVLATTHVPSLHLTLLASRLAAVSGTVLGLHQTGGSRIGLPSLPAGAVDLLFMLDALVLLSPDQLRHLRDEEGFGSLPWRRSSFAIIPNGVEPSVAPTEERRRRARDRLGVPADAEVVGCVAGLRPEKDHPTLLRAISRLMPAHPSLRLVLIGSGEREQALRAEASALGINDAVVFAGFRNDVRDLLPAMDVFCLVSLQETYPVSVLEAMATSLPVVMTDCPGVPALVEDGVTGFMVGIGDDAEIAARVETLLSDGPLREAMGAAGRALASSRHSLRTTIERHAALFRHLAGRTGGPLVAHRRPVVLGGHGSKSPQLPGRHRMPERSSGG